MSFVNQIICKKFTYLITHIKQPTMLIDWDDTKLLSEPLQVFLSA